MPQVKMDVKLKRNPWTGQVIYDDSSTPLGCVTAAAQRAAVFGAAGVEYGWQTLYLQLLALYDSVSGLQVGDVHRLVDAAWGPVEDQMRVQGVTNEDIVTALGRHAGCITTVHETVEVVRLERAEETTRPVAAAVVEQRAAVAVAGPQLSNEVATEHGRSTVGGQQALTQNGVENEDKIGMTRQQKERKRKQANKRRTRDAAASKEVTADANTEREREAAVADE